MGGKRSSTHFIINQAKQARRPARQSGRPASQTGLHGGEEGGRGAGRRNPELPERLPDTVRSQPFLLGIRPAKI